MLNRACLSPNEVKIEFEDNLSHEVRIEFEDILE